VQYREMARRYNMVDFLLKPYPAEQLEQAIMKFENTINL
jgi:response regulator of citrate/malate metabolism